MEARRSCRASREEQTPSRDDPVLAAQRRKIVEPAFHIVEARRQRIQPTSGVGQRDEVGRAALFAPTLNLHRLLSNTSSDALDDELGVCRCRPDRQRAVTSTAGSAVIRAML